MNPEETPTAVIEPPPTNPTSNGEYLYFRKVLANMPFYVDRKPVMFEPLDRNMGVLKISAHDPTTSALLATAKANRGGVVVIDEETYETLKKKLPFKPLAQRLLRPKLQVFQNQVPRKAKPQSEVAAGTRRISSGPSGVGSVGGGGTDASAGTPASDPVPPPPAPGEFRPAVGRKNFKMPVLKKPTGNSLAGGIDEPEPTG